MKACVSQACTMASSFQEDVEGFARAGCQAMEAWLTKLEKHVEKNSLESTRKLLADHSITLTAGSYQGGLLQSAGEQRQTHIDHFRQRLDLCQGLGIPLVLLCADLSGRMNQEIIQSAVAGLTQAAQWAEAYSTAIALEFRSTSAFCNNLQSALAMVNACGMENLGVNLDLFHFFTGPSKTEDLVNIPTSKIFFVQASDLAGVPRELATDADRIFPGEGEFPLTAVFETLKKKEYHGWVSFESFNPVLSQASPEQIAELGLKSIQRMFPPG